MVARAVWSGMITFGLVSVPVGLYTATEDHEPSFHQFARGTTDRIRYKRVNERTGREVDYDKVVKGADVGDGTYVMISDEELDQIAPGRSRALEISDFVDLDEIDPVYFDRTYYLAPAAAENKKTYALLRDAMAASNRAGICSFVMHGKEHLAAIRAAGTVLVLETLFFSDEVRKPAELLDNLPGKTAFSKGELEMATRLIDSMAGEWKPSRHRDTYTDRINELIEAKRKGGEVELAEEAPEATTVVDLLDALSRSVDSARKAGRSGRRGTGTTERRSQDKKADTRTSHRPAARRKRTKKAS